MCFLVFPIRITLSTQVEVPTLRASVTSALDSVLKTRTTGLFVLHVAFALVLGKTTACTRALAWVSVTMRTMRVGRLSWCKSSRGSSDPSNHIKRVRHDVCSFIVAFLTEIIIVTVLALVANVLNALSHAIITRDSFVHDHTSSVRLCRTTLLASATISF